MAGAFWEDDETAIILYFVSRKVDHQGCCRILKLKTGKDRSVAAVRCMLVRFHRPGLGLWSQAGGWNRAEVDRWLLEIGIPCLQALTYAGTDELEQVAVVRPQSTSGSSGVDTHREIAGHSSTPSPFLPSSTPYQARKV